jgi:hypothetical protein
MLDQIERAPLAGNSAGFTLPSVSDLPFTMPNGYDFASGAGASIANAVLGRIFSDRFAGGRYGGAAAALAGTGAGLMFGGLGPGLLLGGIAGSIASNFGPRPSDGPNAQAWLGRGADGLLQIAGASGDNGISAEEIQASLGPFLDRTNSYLAERGLSLADLPEHFQVRVGGGAWGGQNPGMDPTIELGPYMAPFLGENSLLGALMQRGFIPQDSGLQRDPARVFNNLQWLEPEEINPVWRAGVQEMTMSPGGEGLGFMTFDPARAQPFQYDEWGGITAGTLPQAQSAMVRDTYGQTYNQLQPWQMAQPEIGGA